MRQYLLDSAPLAGYLHGRKPFIELIIPLIQHHRAATSIMVYAEVIEYLKGLPDFTHRKKQLQILLRDRVPPSAHDGAVLPARQLLGPRHDNSVPHVGQPGVQGRRDRVSRRLRRCPDRATRARSGSGPG